MLGDSTWTINTISAQGHGWITRVIVPKGVVVAAEHDLGSRLHQNMLSLIKNNENAVTVF